MGIAWFDDVAPDPHELELRIGGLPLLPAEVAWPACPRCSLPLLFRAQVPLALTALVPFDDERLLAVFECHAQQSTCGGGTALVVGGALELRTPPEPVLFDVLLGAIGPDGPRVRRVLEALDVDPDAECILHEAPPSIAQQTVVVLEGAGAQAMLRPSPPTLLEGVCGGRLLPFDEQVPGTRQTTLPPLSELISDLRRTPMRGLFGGATPGYRDHSFTCHCGSPTRTAVRLLGQVRPDPSGAVLRSAALQLCTRCGSAAVLRSGSKGSVSLHTGG